MSISIARIHIMDLEQIRPDPMDYQLIQCSNFLQLLACVCQIAALVCNELQDLANLIDCIANAFTLSVSGCMIAQINKEIQHINASGKGGGAPNWASGRDLWTIMRSLRKLPAASPTPPAAGVDDSLL